MSEHWHKTGKILTAMKSGSAHESRSGGSLRALGHHCATCHGNDGRRQTDIGRNMYPKAPDMRRARTQDLTDCELFSIIKNGIRLTGMSAWGARPLHPP